VELRLLTADTKVGTPCPNKVSEAGPITASKKGGGSKKSSYWETLHRSLPSRNVRFYAVANSGDKGKPACLETLDAEYQGKQDAVGLWIVITGLHLKNPSPSKSQFNPTTSKRLLGHPDSTKKIEKKPSCPQLEVRQDWKQQLHRESGGPLHSSHFYFKNHHGGRLNREGRKSSVQVTGKRVQDNHGKEATVLQIKDLPEFDGGDRGQKALKLHVKM